MVAYILGALGFPMGLGQLYQHPPSFLSSVWFHLALILVLFFATVFTFWWQYARPRLQIRFEPGHPREGGRFKKVVADKDEQRNQDTLMYCVALVNLSPAEVTGSLGLIELLDRDGKDVAGDRYQCPLRDITCSVAYAFALQPNGEKYFDLVHWWAGDPDKFFIASRDGLRVPADDRPYRYTIQTFGPGPSVRATFRITMENGELKVTRES
ncbi:hypothetical protein ACFPOE_22660 [Caenimonas terrae]|uniref:Uncharacterized protein n=1 Tax=Caenimonas terrae TaxID=696074 RepID=A0ABW0NLZ0_9BURK